MSNFRNPKETQRIKISVLASAAKLFLTKGYTATSVKEIAGTAGVTPSTMLYIFKSKDEILCELVRYVLEGQFMATEKLLKEITEDKILFYAAETTLQLHMAEFSEHIRDLYAAAYSLPNSSAIIQETLTGKLQDIFREQLPHLEKKDFYKLEIASGGVMRGFMTIPCTMWFTMDQKVESFLGTTLKIYDVPTEKIKETIQFVSKFDFNKFAKETIDSMLAYLENNT